MNIGNEIQSKSKFDIQSPFETKLTARKDAYGNYILKGNRKCKVTFIDELDKSKKITFEDIIEVISYKEYNDLSLDYGDLTIEKDDINSSSGNGCIVL